MRLNIGKTDKFVRVMTGGAIIGFAAYYKSWWGLIGLLPLATAYIGFCPLYTVFGFSTCPGGGGKSDAAPPP